MAPTPPLRTSTVLALLAIAAVALSGFQPGHTLGAAQATSVRPQHAFSPLPISFEPNRGQAGPSVRFLARGQGYTLSLTPHEAVMAVVVPRPALRTGVPEGETGAGEQAMSLARAVLHLDGANPHPHIVGLQKLPGTANYFVGNDPRRWRTDIPTFARVEYRNIYRGVNLVYYGRQGHLEYDWMLQPGADATHIRLGIRGNVGLHIDGHGNLVMATGGITLIQRRPTVYQRIAGERRLVSADFALSAHHTVGFRLGTYDRTRPLVIDPTLVYSTFLGGSNTDGGAGIAVGGRGNAYITGDTLSLNFPVAGPVRPSLTSAHSCRGFLGQTGGTCVDAFVSKLSADGKMLLYSTYLGGSLDDYGYAIAVDKAGSAYLSGGTLSANFPAVNALQPHFGGGSDLGDAFVAKLNPAGNALLYSTYLGGRRDEDAQGIGVSRGEVYLAGRTNSGDFPLSHPFRSSLGGGSCRYAFHAGGAVPCYDAFVTKLNVSGRRILYSTYLGGEKTDFGWGIRVHGGRAIVVGQTSAANFPTRHPVQGTYGGGRCGSNDQPEPCDDAFVAELAASGRSLLFSTYLGGHADDIAHGVAVDRRGNVVVVGETYSRSFPVAHALQPKFIAQPESDMGFVTKIASSGRRLLYSTYLGGTGAGGDEAYDAAVDAAGDAYVVGSTTSGDFPTVHAFQPHLHSGGNVQNGFITELSPGGTSMVFSSYLGGGDHDLAGSIALDQTGDAYVTGFATSRHFPTVHALQAEHRGGTFDAIVVKISSVATPAGTPTAAAKARRHRSSGSATTAGAAASHRCAMDSRLVRGTCRRANG